MTDPLPPLDLDLLAPSIMYQRPMLLNDRAIQFERWRNYIDSLTLEHVLKDSEVKRAKKRLAAIVDEAVRDAERTP